MSGIEPVSEVGSSVSQGMDMRQRRYRSYVDELSAVLGMYPGELARQLRNGASLAELAARKGVLVSKVIGALQALMAPTTPAGREMVLQVVHQKVVVRHRVRTPGSPTPTNPADRHATPRRSSRVVVPRPGTDAAAGAGAAGADATDQVPPEEDGTTGSVNTYA